MKNWLVGVKSYGSGCTATGYLAILIDTSEIYAHVVYGPERHPALARKEKLIPLCRLTKSQAEKLTPEQALEENKDRIRILPADEIRRVNNILPPSMYISTE